MSVAHLGKPSGRKGKHLTKEAKEKLRAYAIGRYRGNKSPCWKGGVNPIHDTIRKSLKYKLWRTAVYKRDNYICQLCSQRGGRLEVHHKKPFAKYPKLRFRINNGITLCVKCHMNIDKDRGRRRVKHTHS